MSVQLDLQAYGCKVLLDSDDLEWASERSWHLGDTGYVKGYRGPGQAPTRMHRLIMERGLGRELRPDEFVDHMNGNRLDNRRSNLRLATKSQNGMNRGKPLKGNTPYVGVHYDVQRARYMAYISVQGQRFYLGRFADELEAAWMYDQWAIELHDEFARLNLVYV